MFNSTVEALPLRRRASRLIPLPVPGKPKTRQLILTNRRLICLKQRLKSQDAITIKSELLLRPPEKLKEKDKERESRGILVSVERKTEREFAVLTVNPSSHRYSCLTAAPCRLPRRSAMQLRMPIWHQGGFKMLKKQLNPSLKGTDGIYHDNRCSIVTGIVT